MVKAPNLIKGQIRRFDSCWMRLEKESLLTEAFRFGFGASDVSYVYHEFRREVAAIVRTELQLHTIILF